MRRVSGLGVTDVHPPASRLTDRSLRCSSSSKENSDAREHPMLLLMVHLPMLKNLVAVQNTNTRPWAPCSELRFNCLQAVTELRASLCALRAFASVGKQCSCPGHCFRQNFFRAVRPVTAACSMLAAMSRSIDGRLNPATTIGSFLRL